jgi:hypothetical protein
MNPHNIRSTLIASSLIVAALASGTAHAELQGRNMGANFKSFEAYYDTVLDVTWLADANYAQTSGYDADGEMTWSEANAWAANLSFYNPLTKQTYNNWRLPTTTDMGAAGCTNLSNPFSGTDCGYNVDPASSEMAYLYFVTLGNQSYFTTTGEQNSAYVGDGAIPGGTPGNVGPFTNFQSSTYWSGTEYAPLPSHAWVFGASFGFQDPKEKTTSLYAWAVSPGDIAAVPEAQTYALMLAGLGLIGWRARRRG